MINSGRPMTENNKSLDQYGLFGYSLDLVRKMDMNPDCDGQDVVHVYSLSSEEDCSKEVWISTISKQFDRQMSTTTQIQIRQDNQVLAVSKWSARSKDDIGKTIAKLFLQISQKEVLDKAKKQPIISLFNKRSEQKNE